MGFIDAIILGIVQGVTEFLPISSSGHLILVRDFLGVSMEGSLAFDVMLHLATLLVVVVYFRKLLMDLAHSAIRMVRRQEVTYVNRMLIYGTIIGTIPAVLVGLLWGDVIGEVLRDPFWVAGGLIVGSIIMWVSERLRNHTGHITLERGVLVGLFQVLAFVPGMSRSGVTMAGGMFGGMSRENSAEFSFLLAIPVIAGAGLQQLLSGGGEELYSAGLTTLVGAISAFVAGFVSIHFLMKFVRAHRLDIFVYYRLILASVVLVMLFV